MKVININHLKNQEKVFDENGKKVEYCFNCGKLGIKVEYFGTYGFVNYCKICGDIRDKFRNERREAEFENRHDEKIGCECCIRGAEMRMIREENNLLKHPKTTWIKENYFKAVNKLRELSGLETFPEIKEALKARRTEAELRTREKEIKEKFLKDCEEWQKQGEQEEKIILELLRERRKNIMGEVEFLENEKRLEAEEHEREAKTAYYKEQHEKLYALRNNK